MNIQRDLLRARSTVCANFLAKNQREFITAKRKENEDLFFQSVRELFLAVDVRAFVPADWHDTLRLLLARMNTTIRDALLAPYEDFFHNLKNLFTRLYVDPLQDSGLSEEAKKGLAMQARDFLDEIEDFISGRRVGDAKPISVFREILTHLVGWRGRHPAALIRIDRAVRIVAWDGAKKDSLLPMLWELRRNADNALRHLPDEQQTFRVAWEKQTVEDSDYGVLTVANAFIKGNRRGLWIVGNRTEDHRTAGKGTRSACMLPVG